MCAKSHISLLTNIRHKHSGLQMSCRLAKKKKKEEGENRKIHNTLTSCRPTRGRVFLHVFRSGANRKKGFLNEWPCWANWYRGGALKSHCRVLAPTHRYCCPDSAPCGRVDILTSQLPVCFLHFANTNSEEFSWKHRHKKSLVSLIPETDSGKSWVTASSLICTL